MLESYGHYINWKAFSGTWIYASHMPLFFIFFELCFFENKYPTFTPFLKKNASDYLVLLFSYRNNIYLLIT